MFALVALIITVSFCAIKRQVWLYLALYGFAFVVFSVALDGLVFDWWEYMFVYDRAELTLSVVYFWMVFLVSYLFFFIVLFNRASEVSRSRIRVKDLRFLAVIFTLLSGAAGLYNFLNAGNPALILIDSRSWELAFGRNVITNYLYFTHLVGLVALGIIVGSKNGKLVDYLMVFSLLLISTFHGIKFTILHAFIFYSFSYWIASGERIKRGMVIAVLVLTVIILFFFTFARGGGVGGFLNYVVSASVNSVYIINTESAGGVSSAQVLNPISVLPIDRFRSRVLEGDTFEGQSIGFVLNDSYNLQHAITRAGYAFGTAFVFFSIVFAATINTCRRAHVNNIYLVFLLVFVMNVLVFYFTAFELLKTKLWFCFFVAVGSHFMLALLRQVTKMRAGYTRGECLW